MSALTVELPDSLYTKISELAEQDGISLDQFISTAAAEKMSAMLTDDFLRKEAELGNQADFEEALKKVPDVPAAEGDELPASSKC